MVDVAAMNVGHGIFQRFGRPIECGRLHDSLNERAFDAIPIALSWRRARLSPFTISCVPQQSLHRLSGLSLCRNISERTTAQPPPTPISRANRNSQPFSRACASGDISHPDLRHGS
jgi:hypothetical protein